MSPDFLRRMEEDKVRRHSRKSANPCYFVLSSGTPRSPIRPHRLPWEAEHRAPRHRDCRPVTAPAVTPARHALRAGKFTDSLWRENLRSGFSAT